MQAASQELGLEPPTAAAVKNIIGLGLPEAIAMLFPQLEDRLGQQLRLRYSQQYVALDKIPSDLFEGAMDTLGQLRQQGHVLAVATGKSRRGLDRVLDSLGMTRFFDASRCADETLSKPDPLMLHELLEECLATAADALMIGDTEYDLEMAAAAGVPSVGVSYGSHSTQRLRRHRPLAVLDRLPELLGLELLRP